MKEQPVNKKTILIIEDDPDDVLFIKEYLEDEYAKYKIEDVDYLQKGIERLKKGDIDLALLDLGLPDSVGLDTLKRLYEEIPDVPVVVLTGNVDESQALEAVAYGAQDYLVKSNISKEVVHRTINYAIQRKRFQERIREAHYKLVKSEKMNSLGLLAAGIAHELNNPMMGILNFTQYCLKKTDTDDKRYAVLKDIESTTERCIDIVRNLLTYSRDDSGGNDKKSKEDLKYIFYRILKLLSFRIDGDDIELNFNINDDVPQVLVSKDQIQQVFLNILVNALDAIKQQPKKEIRINITKQDGKAKIVIADSGCGISEENLKSIFDPFFTTKSVGQGTGLGLSVCKNIIEEHKGEISCTSSPNAGTQFKILLPLKEEVDYGETHFSN